MSLKTYLKSEERKSYNGPFSKQYKEFMLSFAPIFYIYLDALRVEFLNQTNTNFRNQVYN